MSSLFLVLYCLRLGPQSDFPPHLLC